MDPAECVFDRIRKAILVQDGTQEGDNSQEGAEQYYRLELNLSNGAVTMKDRGNNVVYVDSGRLPPEVSSSYDEPPGLQQQRLDDVPTEADAASAADNIGAYTDNALERGGLQIMKRHSAATVVSTEATSDGHTTVFEVARAEGASVCDIQKKLVQQLDLRITDYFTHVRCMCSYILYSLHFNDFGMHKVATRRFSDFCYYDKVLREAKYEPPIPLPPKRFWDNMSPSFLSQRFQGLRNYMIQHIRHPKNMQLYMLHMFLGCSVESILYLHLVTSPTRGEKMNAVSILLNYLMRTPDQRVEFLSDVVKPPLTNFMHLSPAKIEGNDPTNETTDYRLASSLVMESLLDCLVFGDHKTVSDVCAIFLYMLHHDDHVRKSVLEVKTITYVTKAISRLLLRRNMFAVEFPYSQFRDPLSAGALRMITHGHQSAWDIASYFLVMTLNLIPEAVRSYLGDNNSLDTLCDLIEYKDYDVLRRFSIWLLWITSFQDDLSTVVDRGTMNSLLKKLYGSEDTTIKMMCGLVLISLIASGWFDKDSEPRALASVVQLLDNIHDLDAFISQQIFSHWSISKFSDLLSTSSLPYGARLFLVLVLKNHLVMEFEGEHREVPILKLCEADYLTNVSEVTDALFGNADPDYRSDIAVLGDNTFDEKLASLYLHRFQPLATFVSKALYDIVDSSWGDSSTTVKEDDTEYLSYHAALCLLLLPYDSPTSMDNDFFDVYFNPRSGLAHFRNVVHLKGELLRLQVDSVEQINLDDSVLVRLDRTFFCRRVAILRAMLSRIQESLTEFQGIHLSNNELPNDCMALLRRCWSSKELIEHSEGSNVVVNFSVRRNDQVDLFNNFAFPGMEASVFDVYSTVKSVDMFEMCKYANHMLQYNSVQQSLLKLVRFCILYHQACDARLSMYSSMIATLESRVKDIRIGSVDDLVDMAERFLVDSHAYQLGLQEEGELVSKLQEKNLMLTRVDNMLKSTNSKLSACRKQVSSIQKRIDDIPRLRNDSMANKNQLNVLTKDLEYAIASANEKIMQLQLKVAHDERLKQDYSERVNQVTHFSSALDSSSLSGILKAIDGIKLEDLRLELEQLLHPILSEHMHVDELDMDTVFRLKSVVLNHLNSVQDKLNSLYSSDTNHQIAMLNRKVQQDEERLYLAQVELKSANKSLFANDSVLQESLSTHKLMLNNLESTSSNLGSELKKINDLNHELDKRLGKVKAKNDFTRSNLERTRFELIESIKEQRQIRLESFWHILAAEFMCKKICQEQTKLSTVLAQKSKLLDILRHSCAHGKAAHISLIESFKVASQRLQETAEFLEGLALFSESDS
ncbi:hypothetical protein X943_003512 [Babesia divergens]|uniref:PX domain-containing protein n=1 Tax=Babesia divergens TaxID=32595 RepID=A0AAD9G7V1_BABDI|nr:hypothetical protein X943_003512 [Babesia divergens]